MILTQTRYAGNVTEIGSGFGWSNLANLAADDGSYATASMTSSVGKGLLCQGFGFEIPDNAIITRFECGVAGYTDWPVSPGPPWSGWPTSDEWNLTLTDETYTFIVRTAPADHFHNVQNEIFAYGDNSGTPIGLAGPWNLIGDNWGPSDINDDNFGVVLSEFLAVDVAGGWNLFLNYVRMSVTYRIPTPCNQVIMF